MLENGTINDSWLPLFVRPKEDELLSSWLIRLATAHNVKAHSFTKFIFQSKDIWNRDIDRCISSQLLQKMAAICNVSQERAAETSLASYEGKLFAQHQEKSNTRWIIPSGVYHRTRKRFAQQFCPGCLQKDGEAPYFRRKWRLSLSVCCPKCNLSLIDRCPSCEEPIVFFRNELGQKNKYPDGKLNNCYSCGYDLKNTPNIVATPDLLDYQTQLYKILEKGYCKYTTYSHLYFDVLFLILSKLCSRNFRTIEFQKLTSKWTGTPYREMKGGYGNGYDWLPIHIRKEKLLMACWLLEDWPNRFIAICQEARCFSFTWTNEGIPPYWFHKEILANLYIVYSPYKHVDAYRSSASYNRLVKKLLKQK